ncbi:MAG: B12-binding domain-containing radical SAM protein, partial [Oscillospiraceae bacterium]|nr:B12-binding domain-containing radical SAM protein [Oscillospiraceae bacterium]
MKLTLLAINTKFLHSSLSVWYLLGGLKQFALHSHDCLVVEATINQNLESIVERVVNSEPDLVGISTYIWNIRMLPELIEKLRQRLPKVTILLGGPEAGSNAEYWLNHRADFVLRGEGEYSIAALVDAIEEADGDALKLIPGLCYITDGNTHMNPVNTICNDYINPYGEEYFSNLKGSITYIESSRGCPFSCSYCLSSDQSVKYFPLDVIKQQIDKLSQSGCSTIKFVDRTFNCHPQRAKEIFEYVIGLDTECCFHFEVAADLFDVDLLSLLAAAPKGRIQLEIGLQSYNQKTLKAVRRFQDISRATENIEKLLSN